MATRATIREMARIRADQDSSGFPTDAQYNLIIDACSKRVQYDLVAAGYPIDETVETLNIASLGTLATYQLNSGNPILGFNGVFRVEGSTRYELKRLDRSVEASVRSQTGTATAYLPRMSIGATGTGISLFPQPTGGTYEVLYTPEWPGFAADGDVWKGPARSEELISILAAVQGLRKEGETADANALIEEYRELFEHVMSMAGSFDRRNPATIRDVNAQSGYDSFDFLVDNRRW